MFRVEYFCHKAIHAFLTQYYFSTLTRILCCLIKYVLIETRITTGKETITITAECNKLNRPLSAQPPVGTQIYPPPLRSTFHVKNVRESVSRFFE